MTFWVAGAAVVGGIGGAALSSSAAGKASKTQAASTQAGIDEQARQYDTTRADQAPYRQSGSAALRQYNTLMGIDSGPLGAAQSADAFDKQAYLTQYPDVASDPVYGSNPYKHYLDYGKAEGRQATWTPQAIDANSGPSSPDFGSYAKPLTQAEVMLDPGYQFGLTQGQEALDRKTAAAGGRISGAALKAASEYGTNYATTGYSTAYNRANQARSDRLNRLAALAGIGQTATQQTGAAGQNSANQISGMITAQGNASAAGQLAQGNIWGNAGNQLAALYGRYSSPSGFGSYSGAGAGGPVNMGTATGGDMSTFYG